MTTIHHAVDGEYRVTSRPPGGVDVTKVRGNPSFPRSLAIGDTVYFPTRRQASEWLDQQQPARFQQYDDDDKMFIHLSQTDDVPGHPWFVECPGKWQVHFGTVEQANDWCHAQWLLPLFPSEMSEADVHECGPGFYVDLRR